MTSADLASQLLDQEAALLMSAGVASDRVRALQDQSRQIPDSLIALALLDNLVDEFALYKAAAEELRMPFQRSGFRIAPDTPVEHALRSGVAPLVHGSEKPVFALAPAGRDLSKLLMRRKNLSLSDGLITTPDAFRAAIYASCRTAIIDKACHGLAKDSPGDSASGMPYAKLLIAIGLVCAAAAALTLVFPLPVSHVPGTLLGFIFLLNIAIRLSAFFALDGATNAAAVALPDHALPVYSVFVPLYREAGVVTQLVSSLRALDYPVARLDIHFLIEANDAQTRDALAVIDLPAHMHVTILPEGAPQTKPRALNVGLALARGTLCTVYDAEDRPAPDQLRKAAAHFAVLPADYACLQASLAIDHAHETWITNGVR